MNKVIKVGINGFGRIGRTLSRIILQDKNIKLAAINSRSAPQIYAHLLKYDSSYGTLAMNVIPEKDMLIVNGQKISLFGENSPENIPWEKAGVEIVVDSTGIFRNTNLLKGHLKSKTVKQVILSAPGKDNIPTYVYGVNHHKFNPLNEPCISNSSCTTNCLANVISVFNNNFSVESAYMLTVHAVTDSQNILDNSHKKGLRLARSVFSNAIPTTTGSAKDIVKLFPTLSGKITCQAVRIPLPSVSMINLTVQIKETTDKAHVNKLFTKEAGKTKSVLKVTSDELVSIDYKGNSASAIVDLNLTAVTGKLISITAWYDNEWGYASRVKDMIIYTANKKS